WARWWPTQPRWLRRRAAPRRLLQPRRDDAALGVGSSSRARGDQRLREALGRPAALRPRWARPARAGHRSSTRIALDKKSHAATLSIDAGRSSEARSAEGLLSADTAGAIRQPSSVGPPTARRSLRPTAHRRAPRAQSQRDASRAARPSPEVSHSDNSDARLI